MTTTLEFLKPKGLFEPSGYSHVVVSHGPLIHVAGQVPTDVTGATIGVGDFRRQVEQVFANLDLALAAGGGSFHSIAAMTIYCVSAVDRSELKEISASLSKRTGRRAPPAITVTFVASLLKPEWLIEVQALGISGRISTPLESAMIELGA